ncbi:MAG: T9SS type A sorting domain-containing protein [Vicingaceae bacterium]
MRTPLTLAVLLTLVTAYSVRSQTISDTVSLGNFFTPNQVWYNLETGAVTSEQHFFWDFAFEVGGSNAAILINAAKSYTQLKVYSSGDTSSWAAIGQPQSSISELEGLDNPTYTWEKGAFNVTANPNDSLDVGWGRVDPTSGNVYGDSIHIFQDSARNQYKIWMKSLIGGTYQFLITDFSTNQTKSVTIPTQNYPNKKFVYYNIAHDSIFDPEPLDTNWHLFFSYYFHVKHFTTGTPWHDLVTGVKTNSNFESAQVDNVNPITYNNATIQTYSDSIDIIGYDWGVYNSGQYQINNSRVYFLKESQTVYWKIVMTFKGLIAPVDYVFGLEKTKINLAVDIEEHHASDNTEFTVFPNPIKNQKLNITSKLPKGVNLVEFAIYDSNGKLVQRKNASVSASLLNESLNLDGLDSGVYFIKMQHSKGLSSKMIVLE